MAIYSLLRYPGGKTRAVKQIQQHMPKGIDKLCSPFFGGGSLEIALMSADKIGFEKSEKNPWKGISVKGYDLFSPVCWFWKALLEEQNELVYTADAFRLHHDDFVYKTKNKSARVRGLWKEMFKSLQKELRENEDNYSVRNAAIFYALNRSSFSGETLSGGYSKRASYARFTDSSIDRLRDFSAPNLTVERQCFTESIPNNHDTFMYCDPPYFLDKGSDTLYGNKGSMHKGFDHSALREVLEDHPAWVLSYNDCDKIKKMYDKYRIIDSEDFSWAYGMSNVYSKQERDQRNQDPTKKIKMKSKNSEILIIKE